MKLTTRTMRYRVDNGSHGTIEVQECGGLCIHDAPVERKKGALRISHYQSGLVVAEGFKDLPAATGALAELLKIRNWTTLKKGDRTVDLRDKVLLAVRPYGAEVHTHPPAPVHFNIINELEKVTS